MASDGDRRAALLARVPRSNATLLLWVGSALIVGTGVVTALVSLRRGWEPLGDEAVVAGLSRMMLSGELTPVGMPTSFERFNGVPSFHPGPLLFVWLAPWIAVFGRDLGSGLGAAALNLAAVVTCVWAARRAAGDRIALVFLLLGGLGVLVVTDTGLVRPLNSLLSALALLAVLVLAWAVLCGVRPAVPWLLVWASFVVQSHIAYAVVAVAVTVPSVVVHFAQRDRDALRRELRGPAVLLALLWSGPLVDAVLHRGGNLRALVQAITTGDVPGRGWSAAGRFLLGVLGLPPGARRVVDLFDGPISLANLVLVLPVLGLVGWTLWRGGSVERRALSVLGIALLAGIFTATRMPIEPVVRPRVLWSPVVAVFAWAVLGMCALRWVERRGGRRWMSHTLGVTSLYGVCIVATLVYRPVFMQRAFSADAFLHHFLSESRTVVAAAMPPDERYLITANRSVDADRAVQTFIADRVETGHPIAVQATNYWGGERGMGDGEDLDGIVLVTDRQVRAGAHVRELVSLLGRDPRGRAAVVDDLSAFVRESGPLVLTAEGTAQLAEALDGRLPGTCERLEVYQRQPERILDDAPGALVELYQHGRVASPTLPDELEERMWQAPRPGLWVYEFDADLLDVEHSSPDHLILNRLGCRAGGDGG